MGIAFCHVWVITLPPVRPRLAARGLYVVARGLLPNALGVSSTSVVLHSSGYLHT